MLAFWQNLCTDKNDVYPKYGLLARVKSHQEEAKERVAGCRLWRYQDYDYDFRAGGRTRHFTDIFLKKTVIKNKLAPYALSSFYVLYTSIISLLT